MGGGRRDDALRFPPIFDGEKIYFGLAADLGEAKIGVRKLLFLSPGETGVSEIFTYFFLFSDMVTEQEKILPSFT